MEGVLGKSTQWNAPLFIISLDLRKAFDRLEQPALFRALRQQGLDPAYIRVLRQLYQGQEGALEGGKRFPITRGVRQGDVLSPLLFNAALEASVAEWKRRLHTQGIALTGEPAEERLTNIRYADDLLVFAKSMPEAIEMLDLLVQVLRESGLELNVEKTKLLSTIEVPDFEAYIETANGFIEHVHANGAHKYLGRKFPGCLCNRGAVALQHRVSCAWAKFLELQNSLVNKHVDTKLRLKLFDATVSPTALYSLDTCPLTGAQLKKLDAVQNRMLRRIVGWVSFEGETWEEVGSRMKHRLRPVKCWSERLRSSKLNILSRAGAGEVPWLTQRALSWHPPACAHLNIVSNAHAPHRVQGRPRIRWQDMSHNA